MLEKTVLFRLTNLNVTEETSLRVSEVTEAPYVTKEMFHIQPVMKVGYIWGVCGRWKLL